MYTDCKNSCIELLCIMHLELTYLAYSLKLNIMVFKLRVYIGCTFIQIDCSLMITDTNMHTHHAYGATFSVPKVYSLCCGVKSYSKEFVYMAWHYTELNGWSCASFWEVIVKVHACYHSLTLHTNKLFEFELQIVQCPGLQHSKFLQER